jgi:flagellin
MRITYGLVGLGARQYLNRSYAGLNKTTSQLLEDVGTRRARSNERTGYLSDLVAADIAAVTAGITTAASLTTRNDTADTTLGTIYTKLGEMRDLAEDVLFGSLTEEQIAAKATDYEALAEDIDDLLEETTYGGEKLLSGREPVAMFNVEAAVDLDLTDMSDDDVETISLAMVSVDEARADIEADTNALAVAAADLADHSADLTALAARIETADAAMGVLAEVVDLFMRDVVGAAKAQASVSGLDAWQLLRSDD